MGVEDGKSGNGRQMRSCSHSPGKGGAENDGKRDAGKHMGSQTDYSGEGDTPSKISRSLGVISQARLLVFAFPSYRTKTKPGPSTQQLEDKGNPVRL